QQWVFLAYSLALAALYLPAGAVGDRAGRRETFVSGIVAFALASALAGAAPTGSVLIAARALQGVAGAVLPKNRTAPPRAVCAAALVAFVIVERRVAEPLLPFELFRRRNFAFANLETLLVYGGLGVMFFFFTIYLQFIGFSPFEAGLANIPVSVVMILLAA